MVVTIGMIGVLLIGELNGMGSLMSHTPMSLEAETLYSHMVKELFISEQHGVIQRVS